MEKATYYIGLDLGQVDDPTAVAVLERAELQGEYEPMVFAHRKKIRLALRYLERLPLGMRYSEVAERMRGLMERPELRGPRHLVVDATGVGRPVVDMMREKRLGGYLRPVMITGGRKEHRDGEYTMAPKHDLMVNLQVMLQEKQVAIAARIAGMAELLKEMGQMRVKVGGAGREQFGAWREGEHDDLVLAVALACWAVKRDYPGGGDEFRQSVAHPPRDRRESVVFSPSSLQSHTKVK